jgi:hypothetical protein
MLVNLIGNSLLARRLRFVAGDAILAHRIRSLSPGGQYGRADGPFSHEKAPIQTLSQPSIRALIEMLVDGFYEPVFAVMPQGRCGRMLQRNQSLVKWFKHGPAVPRSIA